MTFHSLDFQLIGSTFRDYSPQNVFHINTRVGIKKTYNYMQIYKMQLPLNILISQNDILVKSYKLSWLPSSYVTLYYQKSINLTHFVEFGLKQTNELIFSSRIASNDRQYCFEMDYIETKLGLSVEGLKRDKQFIESIRRDSEKMKVSIEKTSKIDDLRQELSVLCEQIKKSIEGRKWQTDESFQKKETHGTNPKDRHSLERQRNGYQDFGKSKISSQRLKIKLNVYSNVN